MTGILANMTPSLKQRLKVHLPDELQQSRAVHRDGAVLSSGGTSVPHCVMMFITCGGFMVLGGCHLALVFLVVWGGFFQFTSLGILLYLLWSI